MGQATTVSRHIPALAHKPSNSSSLKSKRDPLSGPLGASSRDVSRQQSQERGPGAAATATGERQRHQQTSNSKAGSSSDVPGHILSPARSPGVDRPSVALPGRKDAPAASAGVKPSPKKQTGGQLVRNSANFNPLL